MNEALLQHIVSWLAKAVGWLVGVLAVIVGGIYWDLRHRIRWNHRQLEADRSAAAAQVQKLREDMESKIEQLRAEGTQREDRILEAIRTGQEAVQAELMYIRQRVDKLSDTRAHR